VTLLVRPDWGAGLHGTSAIFQSPKIREGRAINTIAMQSWLDSKRSACMEVGARATYGESAVLDWVSVLWV
jgi:hypothetical protein